MRRNVIALSGSFHRSESPPSPASSEGPYSLSILRAIAGHRDTLTWHIPVYLVEP